MYKNIVANNSNIHCFTDDAHVAIIRRCLHSDALTISDIYQLYIGWSYQYGYEMVYDLLGLIMTMSKSVYAGIQNIYFVIVWRESGFRHCNTI